MQKQSFILLVLIVMTQAISAMDYDYQPFLLWCGALTCKQIKQEKVEYSARAFLGIDENQKPLPGEPFSRSTPSMLGCGNDQVTTEFDFSTSIYEHRMSKWWRALSHDKESKQTDDDYEIGSRVHYDQLLSRSCSCYNCSNDSGPRLIIYPNTIPINEYNFLCGGTCADSTGNLCITCKPDMRAIIMEKKKVLPVQLLWVEKFRKPQLLHEELLLARNCAIIGVTESPILGATGNKEFLIAAKRKT